MTHDELLKKIKFLYKQDMDIGGGFTDVAWKTMLAVVELHKPVSNKMPFCMECRTTYQGEPDAVAYPCPTIQAIEKELG